MVARGQIVCYPKKIFIKIASQVPLPVQPLRHTCWLMSVTQLQCFISMCFLCPLMFLIRCVLRSKLFQQLKHREYGVVQRVDHHGRTAIVHWYRTYTSTDEPV